VLAALGGIAVLIFLLVLGAGSSPDDGTSAPEEQVELTVSVSGDLLIHSPVFFAAQSLAGGSGYDFGPMLEELRPYVKTADLAICHFETPVSDAPPSGLPTFNAPPELADAVAETGWDVCDTASNHSLDQGQEGVDATGEVLDRAGIEHTGSFPSAEAQDEPLIVKANGVRVALIAYSTGTNGLIPEDYSLNLADGPEQVIADARSARDAGADVVLVNMHWSAQFVDEYSTEPSSMQREFAEELAAAPEITAIVGQGPHVVQPIEWMNGKPVVFSEGNLLANQGAAAGLAEASQDGIVALLEIILDADGARVERVSYVPVFVSQPSFTVLPVGDALDSGAADEASLRASYERTVGVAGRGPQTRPIPAKLP
jgi:poly-gamma-glutamate synthesis protein (capsule biosynthesis protein)